MSKQVQITITVPTIQDVVSAVGWARDLFFPSARAVMQDDPLASVRRFSTALILFSLGMAFTLVLSQSPGENGDPTVTHAGWRIFYGVLFLVAGVVEIVRRGYPHFGSRAEAVLRGISFGMINTASFGWLLLIVSSAVWFDGDWARPIPWVIIVFYFARAYRAYVQFSSDRTIERIHERFDSPT